METLKNLSISKVINIALALCLVIMGISYYTANKKNEAAMSDLSSKYFTLHDEFDKLYDHAVKTDKNLTNLYTICKDLDESNQELSDQSEELSSELNKYKHREELYNKYEYALYDEEGNRTDITYDQLDTLESKLKDSKIQDADLILSWIMVESNGQEKIKNSSSTARGYGQFLSSTSKFVYTDLMGESDWTPEVACDGATNMKMMVEYVDYLLDHNKGNLYKTITNYRGLHDGPYVAKLNKWLRKSGKTLDEVAQNTLDRYCTD